MRIPLKVSTSVLTPLRRKLTVDLLLHGVVALFRHEDDPARVRDFLCVQSFRSVLDQSGNISRADGKISVRAKNIVRQPANVRKV